MSIEQEIMNNTPQFGYLIPFLKSTLESGLAYDFIKGIWNKIPIINRMVPAKNIAVPCLEGIVLNTDNEMLQNCFIAILEKSMDNRETDSQHPSFPKILAHLSVDEIVYYYTYVHHLFEDGDVKYPNWVNWKATEGHSMQHLESIGLFVRESSGGFGGGDNINYTKFGEKFLKACLNEKSESLLKGIFSHK